MAADASAYRTLGLAPGASLAEVKRAYRALAKANHPDAAGEAALPRFLAIQAAYDRIVDPDGSATTGGVRPAGSPAKPWEADQDRARATHRAYGGRARRTRTTRPGAGAGGSGPKTTGSAGTGPSAGTSDAGTGAKDAPPRSGRPPRPPKKATLGSTSYDGVEAEPFEPDWGGASWYGTTSGTYWTLNPKEYADPRKHGPEYQARARRAAAEAAAAVGGGAAAAEPASEPAPESEPAPATDPPASEPSHTTASWWAATDAGATAEAAAADPSQDPTAGAAGSPPGPDPLVDATWLDAGGTTIVGRVGRAVAGWAPIALGLSWLVGELTGCGRFSAACDPAAPPLMLVAQLAVLAVLLLVPRLASVAVVGAVGTLVAAIPGALVLASMGGASDTSSSRTVLAVVLVGGWLAGIGVGLVREIRRARPVDRPVS